MVRNERGRDTGRDARRVVVLGAIIFQLLLLQIVVLAPLFAPIR